MKRILFSILFCALFPFSVSADTQLGSVNASQCTAKQGQCLSVMVLVNGACPSNLPVMYAKCESPEMIYCCTPPGNTPTTEDVPSIPPSANASFAYTPLAAIPGQGNSGDFPSYVKALYTFGIFSVGIAGFLMVLVGGFYYITAAGNSSNVEKGKEFIKDALIGVVVAFGSWLVLYIINPDLVNINLDSLTKLKMAAGGATFGPSQSPSQSALSAKGKAACQTAEFNAQVSASASKYGIDQKILQSVLVGGEGCDKRLSTDGFGSCGYSQALPSVRTKCGISGTKEQSCATAQNNLAADLDCAAWLISDNARRCGSDCSGAASCYNSGKANNCARTTNQYCDRVCAYYSS